jgi:hypothetical protein
MQLKRLSVSIKGGEIPPEKTKRFAIKEGDWIWMESPRGKDGSGTKLGLLQGPHPRVVQEESQSWCPESLMN